jgi:hypothetical protein
VCADPLLALVVRCVQCALQLLGYKQAELVGKNVSVLMPAPFGARHSSYVAAFLKSGELATSLRAQWHSHPVLCCAVLCCAVLCRAVPCRAVLCCAVPCRAVLCCAVLCCAVLFSQLGLAVAARPERQGDGCPNTIAPNCGRVLWPALPTE